MVNEMMRFRSDDAKVRLQADQMIVDPGCPESCGDQPITEGAILLAQGDQPIIPLFVVTCAGLCGKLLSLSELIPHIHPKITIHHLPFQHLGDAPLKTIEGMAGRMVGEIRAAQSCGPYRIVGWSCGGILAYEIAMQLLGADQDLEFIGLVDTQYISESHRTPECTKDSTAKELPRFEAEQPLDLDHNQENSICDFNTLHMQRPLSWGRTCYSPSIDYHPRAISSPVHIFRADGCDSKDLFLGWDAVLPEKLINVVQIAERPLSGTLKVDLEELGRRIAEAIKSAVGPRDEVHERNYNPVLTLQRAPRHEAPLFCVPGAGANVTTFIDLIAHLDKNQPIYGLEPRGLDGVLIPHTTVSAATACYLKAMIPLHLNQPINLLGHSFGGWVALEIAHRLPEARRAIASLTLLDTRPPEDTSMGREYTNIDVLMLWIEALELFLGHSMKIERNDMETKAEVSQVALLHKCMVRERLLPGRSKPEVLSGPLRAFGTSLRTPYRPTGIYMGVMRLILVDDPGLDQMANEIKHGECIEQWRSWVPNLIYMHAPGNHLTMLRLPHVQWLARLISGC